MRVGVALAVLVVVASGCGASRTTSTTVTVSASTSARPVVFSVAQAQALARLTRASPDGLKAAVVSLKPSSGLSIEADVTYYCSEHPGQTFFRILRDGQLQVLGTSAETEAATGVSVCIPR